MLRGTLALTMALVAASGCSRCGGPGDAAYTQWRPLLAAELTRAAIDRPDDLYKFLFQGVMGPAHAVPDAAHVRQWLSREWTEARGLPAVSRPPLLVPLRPDGNLVRIDLVRLRALLAAGGPAAEATALDTLAAAFTRTAGRWPKDQALLAELWHRAVADTALWRGRIAGSDLQHFQRELGDGWPAVHHSASYRQRHAPHYRVVAVDLLPASWRVPGETP
jgi:hypothetical protein